MWRRVTSPHCLSPSYVYIYIYIYFFLQSSTKKWPGVILLSRKKRAKNKLKRGPKGVPLEMVPKIDFSHKGLVEKS